MKINKIKLFGKALDSLIPHIKKKDCVTAIILAGGSGTRMNSDVTKQWISVGNMPVIARTVKTFDDCDKIRDIIICVKEDELPLYDGFSEKYGFKKVKAIIKGGNTRQLSALEGFKKISDNTNYVVIHDGARCLVTDEMIKKVLEKAIEHGAAIAASKVSDTVKIATKGDLICDSPDRNTVWLAQTPQIFETEIYRASAYYALENNTVVTDDASLAESAGFKVKLVDCGKENIKITEPFDLVLADAILNSRSTEK